MPESLKRPKLFNKRVIKKTGLKLDFLEVIYFGKEVLKWVPTEVDVLCILIKFDAWLI